MAITFTPKQQSVLNARSHNIIVSAAAGSGKTAVLVERIIRMITEPNPVTGAAPLDIDRLLVVTFTRAAAAQMRERIAEAISKRLVEHPDDRHLQRQETLLHHAQITTIDSFCTFLLRNNFSDINLDPGYRQMDETEAVLLRGDVLDAYLSEQYEKGDPAFMTLTDTWCKGSDDAEIGRIMTRLYLASESHPDPIRWLRERRTDYDIENEDELLMTPWMAEMLIQALETLRGCDQMLQAGINIAQRPNGPAAYVDSFEQIREEMFAPFGMLDPVQGMERDMETLAQPVPARTADAAGNMGAADSESAASDAGAAGSRAGAAGTADAAGSTAYQAALAERRAIRDRITQTLSYKLPALKRISAKDAVDPDLKQRASDLKSAVKKQCDALRESLCGTDTALQIFFMQRAAESLHTFVDLTIGFTEAFRKEKARKGVIDFGDLERLALNILLKECEDPVAPGGVRYEARDTARAYRAYYDEVLIDEYQDSNEVQELLLRTIAGEEVGRYARFMVGDVKQSIYRFRNARPEIFVDKLDHYTAGDPQTERIDLDQNFRSRAEVLDATNDVFLRIMRREIGGVTYDDQVSLKPGAVYETPDASWNPALEVFGQDLYKAQLLLVGEREDADAANGAGSAAGEADSVGGRAADKAGKAGGTGSAANAGAQDRATQNTGAETAQEQDDGGAADPDLEEIRGMSDRKREALAIAHEIKQLVGLYPVTDDVTHTLRPARYRDIVILLRSGGPWNDAIREVFDREGIPLYVDYKAGYFAAEEIREVIQALKVIDNPAQDIPLYGMMRGYYGQFSLDELGRIRAAANARAKAAWAVAAGTQSAQDGKDPSREINLLTAVRTYVEEPVLAAKCREFLARLDDLRAESQVTPIHQFVTMLITQTGYENYVTALPAGAQRRANLQSLIVKAAAFEQTQYAGLFEFLRYIESMRQYEVDYGEANVLDEKADVVRLMTIHKSKGLEFPIVFTVGLAGKFAYKGKDTAGSVIIDPDLGLGIDYIDPDLRARVSTLRKEAVANRIRNSSLGEELRILYVAMTRAKERLYMSGYVGDIDRYRSRIAASRAAILNPEERQLPVQVISSAGSYLDLVMLAIDPDTRIDVREIVAEDLTLQEAQAQMTLGIRRRALQTAAETPLMQLPQPALAMELEERFSFRYPHAELEGLYTKCSVSDVKHTAYEQLVKGAAGLSEETGDAITETAVEMFRIPPEEDADIPRFAREALPRETDAAAGTENTAGSSGEADAAAGRMTGADGTPMTASDTSGAGRMPYAEADASAAGRTAAASGAATTAGARARAQAIAAAQEPLRGAARGTAIHRALQLVDYARWQNPADVSAQEFGAWVAEIVAAGLVPRSYAGTLTARTFLPFLHSGIAARMAAAEGRGELRREQPFVLGVPADTVNPVFPHSETMLVQGIIDAFWIEETDKGRGIVIVDYKTDYIKDPQELIDRYDVQLQYYADALSRILHLPVHERLLYSFRLQQEITLGW